MNGTAKTLNQLVNFLTDERKDKDAAIHDILLINHPAMEQLRLILGIKYSVYFSNLTELEEWLEARSFTEALFESYPDEEDYKYYSKIDAGNHKNYSLKIKRDIFIDGKLKVYTKSDWNEGFIQLTMHEYIPDDLPF